MTGDVRYARFTRAGKQAKQALVAVERALAASNREQFYDAVSRTMQEYLAAKLDLPPGGIDADAVANRGVPVECVQRIRDFFTTCEQVRFAPGAGDGDMRGTLALAQEVIRQLERTRRVAPVVSTAVVLLLVVGSVHAAEPPPVSPQTTFFHANALYKDGQYTAAASDYEQLRNAGLESGNLYFNLGNAYFKAGQRGKAILNYERAHRLLPSDPDVEANLDVRALAHRRRGLHRGGVGTSAVSSGTPSGNRSARLADKRPVQRLAARPCGVSPVAAAAALVGVRHCGDRRARCGHEHVAGAAGVERRLATPRGRRRDG